MFMVPVLNLINITGNSWDFFDFFFTAAMSKYVSLRNELKCNTKVEIYVVNSQVHLVLFMSVPLQPITEKSVQKYAYS